METRFNHRSSQMDRLTFERGGLGAGTNFYYNPYVHKEIYFRDMCMQCNMLFSPRSLMLCEFSFSAVVVWNTRMFLVQACLQNHPPLPQN